VSSKITVQTEIDENFCINLLVRDKGTGMNAQQVRRALIPYAQFDTSLHRKQGGTGLGLPLIRALAELHHAKLKIKSDPDTGTEFRIVFPAERNIVAAQ
jgi:two-component system phosphate regulon sensor histidine kinase PhoR